MAINEGLKKLNDDFPVRRRTAEVKEGGRDITNVDLLQAHVNRLTQDLQDRGISQGSLEVIITSIKGLFQGDPRNVFLDWKDRPRTDTELRDMLTVEAKNKKLKFEGVSRGDVPDLLAAAYCITAMRVAIARGKGLGKVPNPQEVSRLAAELRGEIKPVESLAAPVETQNDIGLVRVEPMPEIYFGPADDDSYYPKREEEITLQEEPLNKSEPPQKQISELLDGVELTTDPLSRIVWNTCQSAQMNLHQLRDLVMERAAGGSHVKKRDVIGSRADVDVQVVESVNSRVDVLSIIGKRSVELAGKWIEQRNRVPSGDSRQFPVGNCVIALDNTSSGGVWLRIIGSMFTDEHDDWTGGRSNFDSSISFQLTNLDVALQMLKRMDLQSKGWEVGTDKNFNVLMEAMQNIFPADALRQARDHMFHRLEVQGVLDLR